MSDKLHITDQPLIGLAQTDPIPYKQHTNITHTKYAEMEKIMVHIYELQPTTSQKSFYGKARVYQYDKHTVLYSYDTAVLATDPETGELCRTWNGWSATTGKHIRSFCGLNKAEYFKLPYRSDIV